MSVFDLSSKLSQLANDPPSGEDSEMTVDKETIINEINSVIQLSVKKDRAKVVNYLSETFFG